MTEREEESTIIHRANMRYCNHHDFEERRVPVDHAFEEILEKRLCPDILENETMFKVKNEYSNRHHRNSVSIEIRKCQNTSELTCKDNKEIEDFLSEIYFTQYQIETDLDYNMLMTVSNEKTEKHSHGEEHNAHAPFYSQDALH